MKDGKCSVCSCSVDQHVNSDSRIEMRQTVEKVPLVENKNRYEQFKMKEQALREELRSLETNKREKNDKMQLRREKILLQLTLLSKSAYRFDGGNNISYLDQMIKTEELEKKYGYDDRILQLKQMKTEEELLIREAFKEVLIYFHGIIQSIEYFVLIIFIL